MMMGNVASGAPPLMGVRRSVPPLIIAAIFLSSYLTWRPSIDIMFTFSDMLFILALLQLGYRRQIPLEPFQFLTVFWMIGFGLLIGGLLIGSLAGPAPSRWVIVSVQYLFAWIVLPMILLRRSREQIVIMVKAFIWGVVVDNLFGIIVYFTFTGTFEEARQTFGLDFLSGGRRLGAFTGDANWNGAVLSMAVPFVIYLRAKGLISKLLTSIWLSVLVFGIMLTASFTAFSSTAVALVAFVAVGNLRPSPRALTIAVIAGALLLIGFVEFGMTLPKTFEARVGNAIGSGNLQQAGTYEGRMQLIHEAWGMAEHHMLVGVGADQYRVLSVQKAPVHNMYLLLWVEGGLLALAGWIMMIAIMFATSIRAMPKDRLATALSVSVIITFLLGSMASPHMYARMWAVPVLLALAITLDVLTDKTPPIRRKVYSALVRAAN